MILESIGFEATAAASTGTAGAAFSGDSLNIKNGVLGKRISLLAWVTNLQADGASQIIAPSYSDTTRGLRCTVDAGGPVLWRPYPVAQPQFPQELLSTTLFEAATAGDIAQSVIWLYYEDVPGLSGRYIDAVQLKDKTVRLNQITASLATGTAGGWSGSEVITAESDLLRANTDYAVLGAIIQDRCCAVAMRAPDWANVRAAVPGDQVGSEWSSKWFVSLSEMFGLPLIPVFNSANKGAINIDAAQDENGTDVDVTWVLAELVTPGVPGGM